MEAKDSVKKMWDDIKKLTNGHGGLLTDTGFKTLFKKHSMMFGQVFNLTDSMDLFRVLDEDNVRKTLPKDGFLNEDEQLLIFSLLKTKMLKCSQRLLEIFEYKKFHLLMVDVRALEKHINSFQETYRNTIYDEELQKYREIGRGKLDEFLDSYSKEFEALQHKNKQALIALETELKVERASIEAKLNSDSHLLKFKPKKELRQYLTSEKLVALEERIEEAMNYRKELEKLSQKEADRLNQNL